MKERLIFHLGHSAGFYSEFNNMVLAILYCQRHNIDFHLYSADANFRFSKGWTDFFLPFCNETRNPVHHYINHRFNSPKGGKRRLLYNAYKYCFPNIYLTSELWNDFRHIDYSELSTQETQLQSSKIIEKVYRFNNKTQHYIDNAISSININEPYVGFHIRGGDKVAEHEIISINQYISRAEAITDIRQGFIYTDDYRYFEALCKKYPLWHFSTLTPPTDQGYYHLQFIQLNTEEKTHKLLNMFASMELLSQASMTFCTFSSNIGMFLGMRMGNRAVGVDMNNWMIW